MGRVVPSVKLELTCLDAASCEVAFEPEGTVVTLKREDVISVEIRGPGTGILEVSHRPDGISIGAWSRGDSFAWDKSGRQLRI